MQQEFRDRNPTQVPSVLSSSRWGVLQPRAVLPCQPGPIQEGKELVSFEQDGGLGLGTSTADSSLLGECQEHRALARLQEPTQPHPHCTSNPGQQPKELHQLPAKLLLISTSQCPRQLQILIKEFIFVR